MGRLLHIIRYIFISGIAFIALTAGQFASCQPVEEPEINWAEWNVSVAYISEVDILRTTLIEDFYYLYSLNQNDGIAYSVSKPLGRFFTAGIGMADLRFEGSRQPAANLFGYWLWPEEYSTRIRNFFLSLRFHPFSDWIFHPYLELKPGIMGVIARVYYPSVHYPENLDLSGKIFVENENRPSLSKIYSGLGGGITWNAGPLLSFDVGLELNRIPQSYIKVVPEEIFDMNNSDNGRKISYFRLVVGITSHSDISKLFKRKNNPYFNGRYEPHEYLPYYKRRKGNR